jgi:siroheme synthase-like protein
MAETRRHALTPGRFGSGHELLSAPSPWRQGEGVREDWLSGAAVVMGCRPHGGDGMAETRRFRFPIFLDLDGKPCTVIGGGEVAARKARSLLAAGARVRVISPELSAAMEELRAAGAVEHAARSYRRGDLEGCALAFAATDDSEANAAAYQEATELGILINVVDDPEQCSFIVPSQVGRGPITVAISTGGASPALARHLREQIERTVPPAYGELAELLGRLREEVKAAVASSRERGRRWEAVLESEVLSLLEQGKAAAAEARAREILGLSEREKA